MLCGAVSTAAGCLAAGLPLAFFLPVVTAGDDVADPLACDGDDAPPLLCLDFLPMIRLLALVLVGFWIAPRAPFLTR